MDGRWKGLASEPDKMVIPGGAVRLAEIVSATNVAQANER